MPERINASYQKIMEVILRAKPRITWEYEQGANRPCPQIRQSLGLRPNEEKILGILRHKDNRRRHHHDLPNVNYAIVEISTALKGCL